MRRALRDFIRSRARVLLRDGTAEKWRQALAMADNMTRCGARTRRGTPCRCRPLLPKIRCRFHGGCSTGAKTPEGKEASRQAVIRRHARQRAEREALRAAE
jgi:hypothetical protein